MPCIFCKIIAGEIPCCKVYEDENYLAFLDVNPRNLGHTLVIPKKHIRWVWDSDDIEGYFKVVQKIANAQRKAFNTDWVVSLILGEEVEHAHVWLVPRFPNDGHGGSIKMANVKKFSDEEMREAAVRLKNELARIENE